MIEVSSIDPENLKNTRTSKIRRIHKFQTAAILMGAVGMVIADFRWTLMIVIPIGMFLIVTGIIILNLREGAE
jgi:hypothetical protein